MINLNDNVTIKFLKRLSRNASIKYEASQHPGELDNLIKEGVVEIAKDAEEKQSYRLTSKGKQLAKGLFLF